MMAGARENAIFYCGCATGALSDERMRAEFITSIREDDLNLGYLLQLRSYLDEIIKGAS